jgi:chromosome segregation ATPase
MSDANGSLQEALERVKDVEDDAAKERRYVRGEFKFIRDELRDLKTAMDLILEALKVEEDDHG